MEGRLPETVLKGGAGSGVLRPRLVTAGSGGPGHRPGALKYKTLFGRSRANPRPEPAGYVGLWHKPQGVARNLLICQGGAVGSVRPIGHRSHAQNGKGGGQR